jgi:hypothetical protein
MQQFLGIDEQLDGVEMYLYNPFIQSLSILESNQLCIWYCYFLAKGRTFHRCFLPSFSSFGKAVSEEKIF